MKKYLLDNHGRIYFYILRHRGGKTGIVAKLFRRRHGHHGHELPPFRERQLRRRIDEVMRTSR